MNESRLASDARLTVTSHHEQPTPTPAAPSLVTEASVPVPPGYEIVCELGEGGMGVVYRATDCALNRPVALKYPKGDFQTNPRSLARFLHESAITARLQHPCIPPVYRVGKLTDGRPFLAMKFIDGKTLAEELKQHGPGAARWLSVFEAIRLCLAMVQRGIIWVDPTREMGSFHEEATHAPLRTI